MKAAWNCNAAGTDAPLKLPLCPDCHRAFESVPPRLPPRALSNGNLCLPAPPLLQELTFAEQLFVAWGFTQHRLHTLPQQAAPEHRQRATYGNLICFLQSSAEVFGILSRPVSEANELLTVLFPAESAVNLKSLPEYQVRRRHVEAALHWLKRHNPFYADVVISEERLALLPDDDIPDGFAVPASMPVIPQELGPAAAQYAATDPDMPISAAILDVEGENLLPAELWQHALPASQDSYVVVVPHGSQPLSSFDPGFWTYCFPILFPYGDALPHASRQTQLPLKSWARHLLLRQDRDLSMSPWSLDLHFLSALFAHLHRRDIFSAVRAKIASPASTNLVEKLSRLSPEDFDYLARIIGERGGVREALRDLALVVLSCC